MSCYDYGFFLSEQMCGEIGGPVMNWWLVGMGCSLCGFPNSLRITLSLRALTASAALLTLMRGALWIGYGNSSCS